MTSNDSSSSSSTSSTSAAQTYLALIRSIAKRTATMPVTSELNAGSVGMSQKDDQLEDSGNENHWIIRERQRLYPTLYALDCETTTSQSSFIATELARFAVELGPVARKRQRTTGTRDPEATETLGAIPNGTGTMISRISGLECEPQEQQEQQQSSSEAQPSLSSESSHPETTMALTSTNQQPADVETIESKTISMGGPKNSSTVDADSLVDTMTTTPTVLCSLNDNNNMNNENDTTFLSANVESLIPKREKEDIEEPILRDVAKSSDDMKTEPEPRWTSTISTNDEHAAAYVPEKSTELVVTAPSSSVPAIINNNTTNNINSRSNQPVSHCDIWGRVPAKEPVEWIECSVCNKATKVNALRFASHLDKCMGIGTLSRNSNTNHSNTNKNNNKWSA